MNIKTENTYKTASRIVIATGIFIAALGLAVRSSMWLDNILLWLISTFKRRPLSPFWLEKLQFFGMDLLLFGIVVAVIGLFVVSKWSLVFSKAQNDSFILTTTMIIMAALWLPVVLFGHSSTIAGEKYWWLDDDAMISMKYARNLADGFGLVWNPGDRVEGYTNFLWTLYMALVHLLPIPTSKTSLVVLVTNIALAIATVPYIVRIIRQLDGNNLVVIATLVGYVFNRGLLAWTAAGFETALLTFLFIMLIYRIIEESRLSQPKIQTYAYIAIMSLVRADAAVLSVLLYGTSFILNKERKTVFFYSAVSLIFPIAHEVFRIYYYGDILPNTAYLKTQNWNGKYLAGLKYILDFIKNYSIMIIFAVTALALTRTKEFRCLFSIVTLYMIYVASVGGDTYPSFRFLLPVLPLLMILAFTGIQRLKLESLFKFLTETPKKDQTKKYQLTSQKLILIKAALAILCLVTSPLVVLGYSRLLVPRTIAINNITIGLSLKNNTSPSDKVAGFFAGLVFYFTDNYAIDLLGKSDRYIAKLPTFPGSMKPGHNKFDFDYSLGKLQPDYVVSNFKLPVSKEEMLKNSKGDFAFTGQLFFNEVFRKHCLSNPVSADTWRTVFACNWPSKPKKRTDWQPLPL